MILIILILTINIMLFITILKCDNKWYIHIYQIRHSLSFILSKLVFQTEPGFYIIKTSISNREKLPKLEELISKLVD